MPALNAETASYLRRIKDDLTYGSDAPTRARLVINSALEIVADDPGAAGNSWTVQVTEPAGTSGIVVTPTGTAVVIALAVSAGVATAANTPAALATAFNGAVTGLTARVINAATTPITDPVPVASLAGGADASTTTSMPAVQYLRAQDLSIAFDLLQAALSQSTSLTAVSGTATSVTDGAATFVAGSQIGNLVTFAGNVTAALAGVTARVVSNTATTLTFAADALPAAPAAGDTYTITGGLFDALISDLREGAARGDSPVGSVYGDARVVFDGLVRGIRQLGGTVAEPTSWSGVTAAGSTVSRLTLNLRGGSFLPGQFKGLKVNVTGFGSRVIKTHGTDYIDIVPAFGSAPGAGVATTITVPADDQSPLMYSVHPGAQPGDNARLRNLLEQLEAAVEAFTLPT